MTLLFLPFQNCSVPGQSARSSKTSDKFYGGGTDGKGGPNFVSYGVCANGASVHSSIVLATDGKSAQVLIEDCEPLAQPRQISPTDWQYADVEKSVIIFDGRILDRQFMSGEQKVTIQICQASGNPTIQARIWETLGPQGRFFGRVVLGNGQDSGDLTVTRPPASDPNHFVTEPGQPAKFDLRASDSSAVIDYQLTGESLVSRSGLSCLDQARPVFDDGYLRASSGLAQHINLLSAYQVRPFWKVAGVDYAVGFPATLILKNPALINRPGVSVDLTNRLIRITGNNITLDGYDFTMGGGFGVYVVGAADAAITNSYLESGIQTDRDSRNLTVSHCVLDGGGDPNNVALINMLGTGRLTVEHNWLRNFSGRGVLDNRGTSVIMQYNLIEGAGSPGNGAFNYLYFTGTETYAPIRVMFNTVYQSRFAGSAASIGFVLDGLTGSTVTAEFAYNTMITRPSGVAPAIQALVQGSTPGTVTAGWLHHNYVDGRGAGSVFTEDPTAGLTNFYSNNFDLNTGAALR